MSRIMAYVQHMLTIILGCVCVCIIDITLCFDVLECIMCSTIGINIFHWSSDKWKRHWRFHVFSLHAQIFFESSLRNFFLFFFSCMPSFASFLAFCAWNMRDHRTFVNSTFKAMNRTRASIGFKCETKSQSNTHYHAISVLSSTSSSSSSSAMAWAVFTQHDTMYLAIVLVLRTTIYECHLHLI